MLYSNYVKDKLLSHCQPVVEPQATNSLELTGKQPPLWMCPGCGLVLGFVTRTRLNDVQVSRLHLFCKPAEGKLPAVIADFIWPATVHCLECGAQRKWRLDEELMRRLVV